MDDVACAFNKFKINVADLEEFISWVDTPEFELKGHNKSVKMSSDSAEIFDAEKHLSLFQSKQTKKLSEHLGFCKDRSNKELLERESDEEFEYVYDYMPLMTRRASLIALSSTQSIDEALKEQRNSEPNEDTANKQIGVDTFLEQASTVVKNGTTFEDNTWNSVFKPKFFRSRQIQTEMIQQLQEERKEEANKVKFASAKLREHFHKPRSLKYEKKLYLNAASSLSKSSNSSVPMPHELLTALKPSKAKEMAIEEILPTPVAALLTSRVHEGEKEPGEIVLNTGKIENVEVLKTVETQIKEEEKFTENLEALNLTIKEEVNLEKNERSSPTSHLGRTTQPAIKLKIKDKVVIEEREPHVEPTETGFNLVIKKHSDSSASVVFKNTNKPTLPKLKIFNNSLATTTVAK